MRINSKDFRVRPGEKVKLSEWPTRVKPFPRPFNLPHTIKGLVIAFFFLPVPKEIVALTAAGRKDRHTAAASTNAALRGTNGRQR